MEEVSTNISNFGQNHYSMNSSAEATTKESILLLYGMSDKPYGDMTAEEKEQVSAAAFERAKEAAFTRGLPIIYGLNGLVIAEYASGQRFERENGRDIRPYNG